MSENKEIPIGRPGPEKVSIDCIVASPCALILFYGC